MEINLWKFIFASTDKNKEELIKYTELLDKIKSIIEKINDKPSECGEELKIKFNSDDNLSLNKTLKLYKLTEVIRSVFQEDNNSYPQNFLDKCLYEL